ncbi:DUF3961 domain-containing protein [Bacillus toyonensis]|uniref:DUF3961 domain-containing protein n=1 Tax=Bacillus cereus group TaxID=86661 RepID=UPI0001A0BEB1|nr:MULTISPECIES: DUF3961 domain-containing protein [Bacillus cereus group]EEL35265.1 hypothetical protein bcere0019_13570 [Bacillus cereus Rock3-28]MBJ7946004.1 DUF3961 domain-containing protein [Bacillus cereus group sp. N24]MCU4765699.1 DUF3961 domain-containing protein [Bacillus toyonensis]MCU5579831.1 DUF3961 domain-containing protein [Bacillus toyonensis]OSM14468.1 hypothetical protein BTH38_03465 [Bacillus toyonensis]
MMKMTVDQRFMMPADVVERVEVLRNKQSKRGALLQSVNEFFGLDTKEDCVWFYGFYGVAVSILLFMVFTSNIFDFLFV